jgi:hypothetical protein
MTSSHSKSFDDNASLFILPYNLRDKEKDTRRVLTISTMQLHRAINDRIQPEFNLEKTSYESSAFKESPPPPQPIEEVFPFDNKLRKKVVGGGGVIVHYDTPCRYVIISKDDCSGKRLRIWLENLRILNFTTHILWFSICIFWKKKSEKYKRNTKHITKNTKWWN